MYADRTPADLQINFSSGEVEKDCVTAEKRMHIFQIGKGSILINSRARMNLQAFEVTTGGPEARIPKGNPKRES